MAKFNYPVEPELDSQRRRDALTAGRSTAAPGAEVEDGDRGAARVLPPHSGPVERGRALGVHAKGRVGTRRATHHHESKFFKYLY